MVCARVLVDGRAGVLLADPGYHVPRLVTVMHDRCYPHTGWFVASEEGEEGARVRKEYNYVFCPHHAGYVEWQERVTRDGVLTRQTSLVYTARAYLDAVNVTERRNIVYNFRSLLARDQKGHLVAGLYFPVSKRDPSVTLFHDNGAGKTKIKYKFSAFLHSDELKVADVATVEECERGLRLKKGELLKMLSHLAAIMLDANFVEQLLSINEDICRLASTN